jgi:hypothetical protein
VDYDEPLVEAHPEDTNECFLQLSGAALNIYESIEARHSSLVTPIDQLGLLDADIHRVGLSRIVFVEKDYGRAVQLLLQDEADTERWHSSLHRRRKRLLRTKVFLVLRLSNH